MMLLPFPMLRMRAISPWMRVARAAQEWTQDCALYAAFAVHGLLGDVAVNLLRALKASDTRKPPRPGMPCRRVRSGASVASPLAFRDEACYSHVQRCWVLYSTGTWLARAQGGSSEPLEPSDLSGNRAKML